MGKWSIDVWARPRTLLMSLSGSISTEEMQAVVTEHNRGVDTLAVRPYAVLVDLRGLQPLSQACTELMETAKRHSARQPHFVGSAVIVDTKFIGLQHRRTSAHTNVLDTELTTEDPAEAERHIGDLLQAASQPGAPQKAR